MVIYSKINTAELMKSVPTSDLDFNFLRRKIRELLNDAVASALIFDEEIQKNGDEGDFNEMPSSIIKTCLNALLDKNYEKFGEKFDEIENQIDNTKYKDNMLLLWGPLGEINYAVGNFGSFRSVLTYPVLTTVSTREVMLPKKDGTLVNEVGYLKDPDEVKKLTKEAVYEIVKEVMTEGLGKSLL